MATLLVRSTPEFAVIGAAHNALKAQIGAGAKFHLDVSEVTLTAPAATDLATSLALANQAKAVYTGGALGPFPGHRLDALAHLATDAVNAIASPDATTLATALTLANELKADYNLHRTQAGVHYTNDATNVVTAAAAVDLATLVTLVNDVRTQLLAHWGAASAPTNVAPSLRVVDA